MTKRRPKILIIEDEPIWQGILQETVQGIGSVRVVDNHADALQALRRELFHFAFVDLQLKYEEYRPEAEYGGWAVLREIRSAGLNRLMGTMVVTHFDDSRFERKARLEETLFFTSKRTFDRKVVRKCVEAYLDRYRVDFYMGVVLPLDSTESGLSEAEHFREAASSVRGIQDFFRQKEKLSERTIVGFADLTDSTRYKAEMDFFSGVYKVYEHNRLVSKIVGEHGGLVVKYIGDCTMFRFDAERESDNIGTRALNCVISIQQAFRDKNYGIRKALIKYRTRIGLAIGVVVDVAGDNDAYGLCVDIAARLQALAKPEQILVVKEIGERANLDEVYSEFFPVSSPEQRRLFGPPVTVALKGVRERQVIQELVWDGRKRGISV